jgi:DNA polymerase IV
VIKGVLHVDLDAFFVSVEQSLSPELRGKPVIVGGRPERRGVVAAASYEARAFGVKSAMPLARAYQLCPQAIFLQGNHRRYGEFSEKFMAILSDFTPAMEPGGLDEAFLDITGCDIFGTQREIATKIKARVKDELELVASVGIASCKVVAKIASDFGKPDGLVEVPAGKEKEFLAPLPIDRMPGIGPRIEQALKSLGITTVGALAGLPVSILKNKFGSYGIMLHNHANGIDNRKVESPGEARSISHETTFSHDTGDIKYLHAMLRLLCEKVGARLRREEKYARSVSLKLRFDDFETINRSRTLKETTHIDDVIYETAVEMLDRALRNQRKLVRLIGVEAANLVDRGKQLSLFDQQRRRREARDKAVDRIRQKYGFDAVQSGQAMALKQIFDD